MGGGHGGRQGAEPPVQQHGRQREGLGHGGAGPIQAEKGDVGPPDGKSGADALVEQVPGQDIIQTGGGLSRLLQGGGQGQTLHGALGLLPAGLAEGVIRADLVKGGGQRPLALFFSHHAGKAGDGRRARQSHGLLAPSFAVHAFRLQMLFSGLV